MIRTDIDSIIDLDLKIPAQLTEKLKSNKKFKEMNINEMTDIIDFYPPFLRTNKLVLFENAETNEIDQSVGMGKISITDTNGHFNSTIYLAMCGWLMASTASVHLAYLYDEFAPQVVEAGSVRPVKNLGENLILQPTTEGSQFTVYTQIIKKKLKFVYTNTRIYFGNIEYGEIANLKFALTDKKSIFNPKIIPEV